MTKKPDYCPEWFDIDLYDNLRFASRDELSMQLWLRQLNHSYILREPDTCPNDATDEEIYQHNHDWIIWAATKCLQSGMKCKGSPKNAEDYDPFEYTDINEIISEAKLRDIANLYMDSYLQFPLMRELFQQLPVELDRCLKDGVTNRDWISAEDLLPENTPKERIDLFKQEFEKRIDDELGYSTMVHISLNYSDELIIEAFKKQLAAIRERHKEIEKPFLSRFTRKSERLSDSEIKRIVEYRVFAYIDLYLWGLIQEKSFTNNEMAAMIYPVQDVPLDFDAVDRIARTVKPKALNLLKTNHWLLL